jgi:hypothetical protein
MKFQIDDDDDDDDDDVHGTQLLSFLTLFLFYYTYLKRNFSETGFCPHLHLNQLGHIR